MDIVATLIELQPRSSDAVEHWAKYVEEHRTAAVETLRAEGVSIESWFSISLNGTEYLLCYMRAESIHAAQEVATQSESAVDRYHREFKENAWVMGSRVHGRLLVDLVGEPFE